MSEYKLDPDNYPRGCHKGICTGRRAWREGKGEDQVMLRGFTFKDYYVNCSLCVGEQGEVS